MHGMWPEGQAQRNGKQNIYTVVAVLYVIKHLICTSCIHMYVYYIIYMQTYRCA